MKAGRPRVKRRTSAPGVAHTHIGSPTGDDKLSFRAPRVKQVSIWTGQKRTRLPEESRVSCGPG